MYPLGALVSNGSRDKLWDSWCIRQYTLATDQTSPAFINGTSSQLCF